jgi:hypothetical protein
MAGAGGKKKANWRSTLIMIACMAGGGLLGYVAIRTADVSGLLDNVGLGGLVIWFLLFVVFLIVSYLVHIPLHEAGHLLAGLASGYRFVSYRIGSLRWVATPRGVAFMRLSVPGTGGQCLMDPPERDAQGNYPYTLYNLGGGLVNIILALIALAVWLLAPLPVGVDVFLAAFTVTGLFLGATNIIPIEVEGVANDGKNILAMRKSDAARRLFWAQLRLHALMLDGLRPKDFDPTMLELPPNPDLSDQLVASMAYQHCVKLTDAGRIEEAGAFAEHCLETPKMMGLVRFMFQSELLYAYLMGDAAPELIDEIHTKEFAAFLKGMKGQPPILRIRYAYELLHKRDATAARAIRATFDKLARSYPYHGELEGEQEQLHRIDVKAGGA